MRNAEATRERILEAALAEFSAHGIAGARVDRIAQAARCNKNLIYIYFEDKETLFTTVLLKHLMRIHEEQPFTPDDLPGYAGEGVRLGDGEPRPDAAVGLVRPGAEGEGPGRARRDPRRESSALAEAQKAGHVGTAFPAGLPPHRCHEPGHGLVGGELLWAVARSESRRAPGRAAEEHRRGRPTPRERGNADSHTGEKQVAVAGGAGPHDRPPPQL